VKRAKKKFGNGAPDAGVSAPAGPGGVDGNPGGGGGPGGSETQSVETMLREFGRGGPVGGPAARPQTGSYDQLWQLSMADPHTGLVNRLLLLDRLTQALVRRRRHGGEVVACRVDLENLAEINMDLGYTMGNEVLCEMARRLTAVLRAEDTIGRVGGSEVVVVVTVSDEMAVGPLLRRIQHTLDDAITMGGQDVRLQASLGVAMAEDSESAEDVLARAGKSSRVSRR
jgi:diguanylate cyclase (GGDEF)-like protein